MKNLKYVGVVLGLIGLAQLYIGDLFYGALSLVAGVGAYYHFSNQKI